MRGNLSELIRFIDQNGERIAVDIRMDGGPPGWVTPNKRTRFKIRHHLTAMRIDRIALDRADEWHINDLKVHNRSMFSQCADRPECDGVPGVIFDPDAKGCSPVCFDTLQTAMDFVIEATYVGKNPEGAPLALVATCTAV